MANRFKPELCGGKKTQSVIANKTPCNRRIKECYSKNKSSFYWDCTFMVCIFTIEILFFNSSPPPRLVPLLRLRILKTDALFRRLNFTNIPIRVHHNYHLGGLLNQWSLQNSFQSNKLFANCDLFARKSTHRLLCHVIQLCSRIPNTLPFYAVLCCSIKSHCDDTLPFSSSNVRCMVLHMKWNETLAILIAANLVCSIDFFSAHRLHSLQMQYHLHFNACRESWSILVHVSNPFTQIV